MTTNKSRSAIGKAAAAARRDASRDIYGGACDGGSPMDRPPPTLRRIVGDADREAQRKFAEWMARYRPVEDAIYEERDRRERRRRIRRGRAFGDLCEITEGRAAFCRRTGIPMEEAGRLLSRRRAVHPSLEPWLFLGDMAWSAMRAVRKELTRRIARAKHIAMRPAYYEMERARRLALASERRKVSGRSTGSPCPTREQILDAWIRAKESGEAMLRFGSLMEDLECYVDNSLIRDGGVIIGRRAGIKGWLQMNIPALYLKYKTVMAYKAAAKRMRQIIGLKDPMPLSSVMPNGNDAEVRVMNTENKSKNNGEHDLQDYGADEILSKAQSADQRPERSAIQGRHAWRSDPQGKGMSEYATVGLCTNKQQNRGDAISQKEAGDSGLSDLRKLRATAIYHEIIGLIGSSKRNRTRLVHKLKDLTDPNAVEDANMLAAWKRFYENKITVRTKSTWSRRLLRAIRTARQGLRAGSEDSHR